MAHPSGDGRGPKPDGYCDRCPCASTADFSGVIQGAGHRGYRALLSLPQSGVNRALVCEDHTLVWVWGGRSGSAAALDGSVSNSLVHAGTHATLVRRSAVILPRLRGRWPNAVRSDGVEWRFSGPNWYCRVTLPLPSFLRNDTFPEVGEGFPRYARRCPNASEPAAVTWIHAGIEPLSRTVDKAVFGWCRPPGRSV